MKLIKKNKTIFQNQFNYFIHNQSGEIYFQKESIIFLFPTVCEECNFELIDKNEVLSLDSILAIILKDCNINFYLWMRYIIKKYLCEESDERKIYE